MTTLDAEPPPPPEEPPVVLTGATRGIGRALALALPPSVRVHAIARDADGLASLASERANTVTHVVDLSSRKAALRIGAALVDELVGDNAVLVHNAGVWPPRREVVDGEGLERAFLVNCASPLRLQEPLLERDKLARILVVGAGLMVKGRFDATRTPTGEDYSWFRTYCTTKLAFAVAMRDVARARPELDVAVVHPGVVRTDLGSRPGLLGRVVALAKRGWEATEVCAKRLAKMLDSNERWSPPGDARWFFEGEEQPWPAVVDDAAPAVRESLRRFSMDQVG